MCQIYVFFYEKLISMIVSMVSCEIRFCFVETKKLNRTEYNYKTLALTTGNESWNLGSLATLYAWASKIYVFLFQR